MIFENGRHTLYDIYIIYIYNSKIDVVTSFKYLGVHLFKNGNWYRTQQRVAQHASFSLHNLFAVYNNLDLPISNRIELFDSLILPTINYGAEIWGYHEGPDVEIIHSKLCRKILGVRRSTNREALYGELGRIPMSVHRKILIIKYWIRLITLNANSLIFKTYNMLKTDTDNELNYKGYNWASKVKQILNEHGLGYFCVH